jgi:hypothetical protein
LKTKHPLQREDPQAGVLWQNFAVCTTGWVCLAIVLVCILVRIWQALFIPWWFNTDEVDFFFESIRQLRLDPSQTFFNIPGTPYTILVSILTALWWAAERLVGLTAASNPSDFAFQNIQHVFTLMRMLTLGMYLVAAALVFDLFRRAAGALTAIVAALLFVSLPIYVQYSYFTRTESLGLVLSSVAIWIVLYSRWRGTPKVYACAGILAGVAMATRYHFALVAIPVILTVYFCRDREELPPEPDASSYRTLYKIAAGLAGLFIAGAMVTVIFKTRLLGVSWLTNLMMLTTPAGPAQYAGAKQTIAKLWLVLGSGAATLVFMHAFPSTRRYIWPVINPFTLMFAVFFVAGFLLSNPEFLWRGEHQLHSIQFYSDWMDPKLASIGLLHSWWNVSTYYFVTAFPEHWLWATFGAGVAIIVWQRRPVAFAFLTGAMVCFLAHPVRMKLWPHHVIPWLPFLCFVAAVPVGWLGEWIARRYRAPALAAGVVLLYASTLIWACAPRLKHASDYLIFSRGRTDRITEMNQWLSRNVPSSSYLLLSYYALNDDGFLERIKSKGVRVPEFMKRRHDVRFWEFERSAIDGQAGFLCISRFDVAMFRDDAERQDPGETYNPFETPGFQPMARFGDDFFGLQVFKFDFRQHAH